MREDLEDLCQVNETTEMIVSESVDSRNKTNWKPYYYSPLHNAYMEENLQKLPQANIIHFNFNAAAEDNLCAKDYKDRDAIGELERPETPAVIPLKPRNRYGPRRERPPVDVTTPTQTRRLTESQSPKRNPTAEDD